jgi:hypothetical protein
VTAPAATRRRFFFPQLVPAQLSAVNAVIRSQDPPRSSKRAVGLHPMAKNRRMRQSVSSVKYLTNKQTNKK